MPGVSFVLVTTRVAVAHDPGPGVRVHEEPARRGAGALAHEVDRVEVGRVDNERVGHDVVELQRQPGVGDRGDHVRRKRLRPNAGRIEDALGPCRCRCR